jgi:hypothetical protein
MTLETIVLLGDDPAVNLPVWQADQSGNMPAIPR